MIWNLKTTNTGMMRNKHVDKNEDNNNESKNIVALIGGRKISIFLGIALSMSTGRGESSTFGTDTY